MGQRKREKGKTKARGAQGRWARVGQTPGKRGKGRPRTGQSGHVENATVMVVVVIAVTQDVAPGGLLA